MSLNQIDFKNSVDLNKYNVAVIVARFQADELHFGQRKFVDFVNFNHDKVIIFLGVARISYTRKNPLEYAIREQMVKEAFPHAIVLPIQDQRDNKVWTKNLDAAIQLPFGECRPLLYGSRDSFIPFYSGKYDTVELLSSYKYNGTEVRLRISQTIVNTPDFRKGIIYAVYNMRPVTYPTVDITAYNEKKEILLGKKPGEDKLRFLGGFVDRTDKCYEEAAIREFGEETGGAEIADLEYIASMQVDDWRYRAHEDGIMTTLFLAKYVFGSTFGKDKDDIEFVKWVPFDTLKGWMETNELSQYIMEEHLSLMEAFICKVVKQNLIA